MSSTTSYRLSGIALLLGSILSIVGYITQAFFNGYDIPTLTSTPMLISTDIGLAGSVFLLLGLPGMYARQAERAGILGLLGFLLVWYVTLFQGIMDPFANITVIPGILTHQVTPSFVFTPPSTWAPFSITSTIGQILGIPLLAIATLRARVFPRWIGWLLIATLVAVAVGFAPFVPQAASNLPAILAGVATAGFGYALLVSRRQEAAQVVPANRQAEVLV